LNNPEPPAFFAPKVQRRSAQANALGIIRAALGQELPLPRFSHRRYSAGQPRATPWDNSQRLGRELPSPRFSHRRCSAGQPRATPWVANCRNALGRISQFDLHAESVRPHPTHTARRIQFHSCRGFPETHLRTRSRRAAVVDCECRRPARRVATVPGKRHRSWLLVARRTLSVQTIMAFPIEGGATIHDPGRCPGLALPAVASAAKQ
jgi:hypothetical protein